jgi:hypothetical protein
MTSAHTARDCDGSPVSGFSALYPLWVAKGDDVFPTVAAQVGDALFREAGVIEPLVLPHAYSHLAPLVGVA